VICNDTFRHNVDFSRHSGQVLNHFCGVFSVGDFLHVLTRVSGFCVVATLIQEHFIVEDAQNTLDFFETQLKIYKHNPEIICNLAFVLQCIKDYHLPVEHYAFHQIGPGLMIHVQILYKQTIKMEAVGRLSDPGSCYVMPVPVGPRPNADGSNHAPDGGHLDLDVVNQSNQPITMINDQNQFTESRNTGDVQHFPDTWSWNVPPFDPQPNPDSSNYTPDGGPLYWDAVNQSNQPITMISDLNQYTELIKTGDVQPLPDPWSCYDMPFDPQPNPDSSNHAPDDGQLDLDVVNQSNQPITMINDQNEYTELINTGDVQRLTDPASSNVMPVDPQPNSNSSNGGSGGGHLGGDAESTLADAIEDWVSNRLFKLGDRSAVNTYKTMKAFILLHALSLGSRWDVGLRLRQFAAKILIKFDIIRFDVCKVIMHSLFLRRQNAVPNPDDKFAVGILMGLSLKTLLPGPGLYQDRYAGVVTHLLDILEPRNFPGPFWLPSAPRLYVQVFTNIGIYIAEAASYVQPLLAKGRAKTGPAKGRGKRIEIVRARAIQALVKVVWGNLVNTDAFRFARAYDPTYASAKQFME
jgi:hypothetical protein